MMAMRHQLRSLKETSNAVMHCENCANEELAKKIVSCVHRRWLLLRKTSVLHVKSMSHLHGIEVPVVEAAALEGPRHARGVPQAQGAAGRGAGVAEISAGLGEPNRTSTDSRCQNGSTRYRRVPPRLPESLRTLKGIRFPSKRSYREEVLRADSLLPKTL